MKAMFRRQHLRETIRLSAGMISALGLGLFILLAILATMPIATGLADFTVLFEYTDALLEGWTLKWDVHALLRGPVGVAGFWDANIFYPYPASLAFSEHLLPTALLLMPFTLGGNTPLLAANLGVLLTTALSGWGMYLLVTWLTRNRWAGLIAGIFFAIAPFRISHINQLHLLSTHWIPFALLATARLIKYNRSMDLALLVLFANLQFFSVINYAPLVALGLAIWGIFCLMAYRKHLGSTLLIRLLGFAGMTLGLNWPVWRLYQQMSARMGVVRTLGDARVYGASIWNYILPIGNSLLYGRGLGLPTHISYSSGLDVSVSTFPGVVVLVLAVTGVLLSLRAQGSSRLRLLVWATLVIVLVGFILSFGANDTAFGAHLAPVAARLLPYQYLYQIFPSLQGLRVPLRFALLTTCGLAILAGIGFALIRHSLRLTGRRSGVVATLLSALILLEHLAAPLPGVSVVYADATSAWLRDVPEDSVVLEMPYYLHTNQSHRELLREYRSADHWRRLVNGASGFKPAWLVALGRELDTFPDWGSFDVLRQLGVNYVALHRDEYDPQAWDNLVALLPGYLPAIEAIHSLDTDLILQLKPPACSVDVSDIHVHADAFPLMAVFNAGPATWVSDPRVESWVTIGQKQRQFLEPLFVIPGQVISFTVPVDAQSDVSTWRVELGNLRRTIAPGDQGLAWPPGPAAWSPSTWQAVQVPFANGVVLQSIAVQDAARTCAKLNLGMQWTLAAYAGETAVVEILDRFGRLVVSSQAQPSDFSAHTLPLAETVPAGLYQLRVRLLAADGTEIAAVGADGTPASQPVSMPLVIRPRQQALSPLQQQASDFDNGVVLLGADISPVDARPGAWLRFALHWQSRIPQTTDYTVFTQLIGPDGGIWGQHDNSPRGGWYSTSLWSPGEVVVDDYAVRIDPAAPPGNYELIVGMYDLKTGERVRVTAGPGAGQDLVRIAALVLGNP